MYTQLTIYLVLEAKCRHDSQLLNVADVRTGFSTIFDDFVQTGNLMHFISFYNLLDVLNVLNLIENHNFSGG